jgi:hypothetical protein
MNVQTPARDLGFRSRIRGPFLLIPAILAILTGCGFTLEQTSPSEPDLAELSSLISEAPGYFDTDNLITNEDSFQHAVPALRKLDAGGVYLGVGPDQNFTYIVHSRPYLAFIVDIRRDNLLLHLYLKALIERSESRREYLARLLGRPVRESQGPVADDLEELVRLFDREPPDSDYFDRELEATWQHMLTWASGLVEPSDRDQLKRLARPFLREGFGLRFRSHGRRPHLGYPDLRRLLTEVDLDGRMRSYLADEAGYRLLRTMHLEDRIIPVVGDLGGSEAMQRLADFLHQRDLEVSVFYVSNVEDYLFRGSSFEQYIANLTALPIRRDAILIRSYFGRGWSHPEAVPGYLVTSLVQPIQEFLDTHRSRPYRHYADVVFRNSAARVQ